MSRTKNTVALIALTLATAGCAGANGASTSNQSLRDRFSGQGYADMVAVEAARDVSTSEALSVRALEAIDSEITGAAGPIIERCLEREMDRLDTRRLSGEFAFEIRVRTSGDVKGARLLGHDVRGGDEERGQPAIAAQFGPCVATELAALSFDTTPELEYVHTYAGTVGEAW